MDVSKLSPGKDVPRDINVVVEIPAGSGVKYEIDKESGALIVDQVVFTPMTYPAAYGFIPGTLADDGDPADALVLLPTAVVPGAVIRCRPSGYCRWRINPVRMRRSFVCPTTRYTRNTLISLKWRSYLPLPAT